MIPPQAFQLTVKLLLNNTKLVTVALMAGLVVVTIVFVVVNSMVFGQGVLQNEPEFRTILIVVGIAAWLAMILAGYFLFDFLFNTNKCVTPSVDEKPFSVQAGSDVQALQQALDALDTDTRASLLFSYLSKVTTRFAIFEGAGTTPRVCGEDFISSAYPVGGSAGPPASHPAAAEGKGKNGRSHRTIKQNTVAPSV